MGEVARGTSSTGRWPHRELLVPAAVLAVYGLGRALAAAWGPVRDGLPETVMGWSVPVLNVAAAVQGITAAVVVANLDRQRGRRSWRVTAVAGAVIWLCVLMWIAKGRGAADERVRDLLLGLAFAVVVPIISGWRPAWALSSDGLDWPRIRRALRNASGGGLVLGAVVLAAQLAIGPGGPARRLMTVLSFSGFVAAFVLFGCMMMALGEQRRLQREAVSRDLYAQLNKARDNDDFG
jgi:hypothetical protein